ncbi:MAG: DUF2975 domain-containing protein [Eubacteriales bacterium]
MKDSRFIFMLNCINVALLCLMACIAAMFVALPFLHNLIQSYFIYVVPVMVFFYAGGALMLWFFIRLRTMILTVKKDTAFTIQNVARLKNLSLALFFLALDFAFIMFYIPSFSIILCIIILVLGVFCAQILAYLIAKAIEYKEDSDLTV